MALNDSNPITPLESQTIRFAILAAVPQVVGFITATSGQVFDIDIINNWVAHGYDASFSLLTIYFIVKTIRARIRATETIATKTKGDKS